MSTIIIVFVLWSAGLLALAWFIFRYIRHEYETKDSLSPYGTFLEILIFTLHGLGINIPFIYTAMPPLTNNRGMLTAAVILVLVGLTIVAASMGGLGWLRTAGRTVGLKQDGLYRYTRNPQIVGYGIVLLSIPLFYASWLLVAWFFLYFPIAHWMVRTEEDHLRRMIGVDFEAYCQKVPRYFGLRRAV